MKHAGPLEVEVKLHIPSTAAMRPRLAQAGFTLAHPEATEANRLWDRAGTLLEKDCALRLRQYGDQATLTWKGARVPDAQLKIRPELETGVADPAAMEAILQALGFAPVLEMVKTRAIWVRGELEACLDDTPYGSFLELEGAREAIAGAMAELGLDPAQTEPRSYAVLYSARTS
ncbi:MAG: class IV adenylate cyclase [Holophaga sp.]|nr:class IV adenylate cyclase [Holophaga sp.]